MPVAMPTSALAPALGPVFSSSCARSSNAMWRSGSGRRVFGFSVMPRSSTLRSAAMNLVPETVRTRTTAPTGRCSAYRRHRSGESWANVRDAVAISARTRTKANGRFHTVPPRLEVNPDARLPGHLLDATAAEAQLELAAEKRPVGEIRLEAGRPERSNRDGILCAVCCRHGDVLVTATRERHGYDLRGPSGFLALAVDVDAGGQKRMKPGVVTELVRLRDRDSQVAIVLRRVRPHIRRRVRELDRGVVPIPVAFADPSNLHLALRVVGPVEARAGAAKERLRPVGVFEATCSSYAGRADRRRNVDARHGRCMRLAQPRSRCDRNRDSDEPENPHPRLPLTPECVMGARISSTALLGRRIEACMPVGPGNE